jgi:gliding motility-associated-like protein
MASSQLVSQSIAQTDNAWDEYALQSVSDTLTNEKVVVGSFENGSISDFINGTTQLDGYVSFINASNVTVWTQTIRTSNRDETIGVTFGADGNIYVCGYYSGTATLSSATGPSFTLNNTPVSNSTKTAFVASYTRAGVLRWAIRDGGQNDDLATSIASTSDGVIVIGSYTNRSATIQGSSPALRLNNSNNDFYIAKYSFTGSPMWFRTGGASNADFTDALPYTTQQYSVVTYNDEIYLSGSVNGSTLTISGLGGTTTGTSTATTSGGQEDVFLLKLNNTGQVQWLRIIEHGIGPGLCHLAVDCSGLYAGGTAYDNLTLPGSTAITLAADQELYLAKLNLSTGNTIWHQIITSADNDTETIRSIYSDSKGSVFVAGDFREALSNGAIAIPQASSLAGFLLQFNSDGTSSSSLVLNGNNFDYATTIAPAQAGQLIVYGHSNSDLDGNQSLLNTSDDIFGWFVDYSVTNSVNCCLIANVPGVASIAPSTVVCPNSTITLSITGNTGTASWEQSSDGVNFTSLSLTGNTVTTTVNSAGFFRARISTANCGDIFSNIIAYTLSAPPTYTCDTSTRILEATTCTASMPSYLPAPTGFVCSAYTFQQSIAPGTALALGTYTVNITNWLNVVVCSFQVQVVETTPPSITCPASLPNVSSPATGACGAPLPDFRNLLTIADECTTSVTITQLPAPNTLISASTNVVFTVTDQGGNSASCTLPIAFLDVTPPIFTACPGPQTGTLLANCSFVLPNYIPLTNATDNCSSVTYTQFPAAGTTISASTTITVRASDASGNTVLCSFPLNLIDTTPPAITSCPLNFVEPLTNDCFILVRDYRNFLTLGEECSLPLSVTQVPAPGTLVTESVNITITVRDNANNSSTCVFPIFGDGSTIPTVLNCPNLPTVDLDDQCEATVPNYLDGLVLSPGCFPAANLAQTPVAGTPLFEPTLIVITYNGTSICSFELSPVDNIAPTFINCPSAVTGTFGEDCWYEIPDYLPLVTVEDNCSNSFIYTQDPPIGMLVNEPSSIVIRATDSAGNSTECTFELTLSDTTPPAIDDCPAAREEPLNDDCQITLTDYRSLVELSDNCYSTISITQSPPVGFTADAPIVVTLEATDGNGNSSSCSFPVNAIPQTVPVINNCLSNQVIYADSHCSAVVPDFTPLLTFDGWCGPTPEFNQWPAAGTIITTSRTVVIQYGITPVCSFILELTDTISPSISNCPGNLTEALPESCSFIIPDYTVLVTATDNCSSDIAWSQIPAAGTSVSATTTIQLIATDEAGNSSQCTFVLNLQDQSPPVITACPSNVVLPVNSLCEAMLPDFTTQIAVTDNCSSILLITQSPLAGTSISETTEVQITAFNANDQFTTCVFTVTPLDELPPSIICPNSIVVPTNTECSFGIPDFESLVTITDNCSSSFTFLQTPIEGSIAQGNQIVAIEVVDEANNSATCSVLVQTEDVLAPSITLCPSSLTRSLTNCVYTVEDFASSIQFMDACDNTPIVTQTPEIGTIINLENSPFEVQIRVTDEAGNFSDCSFEVILNEPSTPVLLCPEPSTFYVTSTSCEAEVSIAAPEAIVNCGTFSITNDFNPNNSFVVQQAPGTYSAVYTLIDEFGQTASCTSEWMVLDSIAPEVICADTLSVNVTNESCSAEVDIPLATVQDNCSIAFSTSSLPVGINSFDVGTHSVLYTAEDASGNATNCETVIEVLDLVAPLVSCQDTLVFSTNPEFCGALVPLNAPSIEENCTIDNITSNLGWIEGSPNYFDLGFSTFEWTVSDLAGNTTNCITIVEVVDDVDPIIQCEALVELQITSSDCFLESELVLPTATDNCAVVSIQNNLSGSAPYTLPVGETVVMFTATDAANNSASCATIFSVVELEDPTITCPLPVSVNASSNSCSAEVMIDLPTVSDNCSSSFTYINSKTGNASFITTFDVGENTFTITAFDESGNSSSCSTSVIVLDIENPEIICPSNVSSCNSSLAFDDPVVSDLCSSVTWEQTDGLPEGSIVTPGNYSISYTATDSANNTSTCSFTITVTEPLPLSFDVPTSDLCADASPINLQNFVSANFSVEPSANIPNFIFDPSEASIGWNIISVTGGLQECPSEASDSIFVNAMPTLTITSETFNCGLVATFTIDNSGGSLVILPNAEYTTSFDGGNSYSISANEEGIYTIEAISVSPEMCETTASATIELIDAPEVPDAGADQLIVQSFSTTLNGTCTNPDSLYWLSENNLTFENVNSLSTTVSGLVEGDNIIYLINDSGECGQEMDSLIVTVDLLVMPNGFSPNGDGVNDFFVIPNTEDAPSSLTIFNRWGMEIWTTTTYVNQWNGVDASGENLPDDTYFYEWVQGDERRTGFIIVKR